MQNERMINNIQLYLTVTIDFMRYKALMVNIQANLKKKRIRRPLTGYQSYSRNPSGEKSTCVWASN